MVAVGLEPTVFLCGGFTARSLRRLGHTTLFEMCKVRPLGLEPRPVSDYLLRSDSCLTHQCLMGFLSLRHYSQVNTALYAASFIKAFILPLSRHAHVIERPLAGSQEAF